MFQLNARHGRALDTYHRYQAETNDCGPHVVAMAINFYHGEERLHAPDVARRMNRPRLQARWFPLVIRRVPNWATFPWGMADMLRQHGIAARWRLLAREAHLHRALDEDRLAMPVFGEPWRRRAGRWDGWSHVAILTGWDAQADAYLFVDSAEPRAITSRPRVEFLRLWRNMGRILVETRE